MFRLWSHGNMVLDKFCIVILVLLVQFYCLHALADGIRIKEKMLEFSSTVLLTLSLYYKQLNIF